MNYLILFNNIQAIEFKKSKGYDGGLDKELIMDVVSDSGKKKHKPASYFPEKN